VSRWFLPALAAALAIALPGAAAIRITTAGDTAKSALSFHAG
jgi:hypothetical protein